MRRDGRTERCNGRRVGRCAKTLARRTTLAVLLASLLAWRGVAFAGAATDAPVVAGAPVASDVSVAAYVTAVIERLPAVAVPTVARIEGDGRKLLAARSYLRAGGGLVDRWSWTEEEIARYRTSDEQRAALAELEKITTRFAELNPGFTLYVNTEVRSLDVQLMRWNENASVQAAGVALFAAAARELATYPPTPERAALTRFTRWIERWRPARTLPVAAPGLSAHGRSRAFDFQVMQGARRVAGTDTSSITAVWDGEGWTAKLATAVTAGPRFRGPLVLPPEPWHYEYVP